MHVLSVSACIGYRGRRRVGRWGILIKSTTTPADFMTGRKESPEASRRHARPHPSLRSKATLCSQATLPWPERVPEASPPAPPAKEHPARPSRLEGGLVAGNHERLARIDVHNDRVAGADKEGRTGQRGGGSGCGSGVRGSSSGRRGSGRWGSSLGSTGRGGRGGQIRRGRCCSSSCCRLHGEVSGRPERKRPRREGAKARRRLGRRRSRKPPARELAGQTARHASRRTFKAAKEESAQLPSAARPPRVRPRSSLSPRRRRREERLGL